MSEEPRTLAGERKFLISGARSQVIRCRGIKQDHPMSPYGGAYRRKLRMATGLDVRPETIKSIAGNTGRTTSAWEMPYLSPTARKMKEKQATGTTSNWDASAQQEEPPPKQTPWGMRGFICHLSDRGLVTKHTENSQNPAILLKVRNWTDASPKNFFRWLMDIWEMLRITAYRRQQS